MLKNLKIAAFNLQHLSDY